ncbi:uncharacterized protein C5L36_0C10620 [Pichia kudriavzevii]|uniref:Importin N-terminal domain-containing protein n=3 Tax=Pichia kudriavzevii TaxID=4909 RepID=A0A2U9R6Z7_PICKU|nr:uncharacterized protein C5L36_0C10620 [Pichia kudriavzevii]AWU77157.1 hypothetical protein C5L36_0C10620 [Pichia kudriavzevii]
MDDQTLMQHLANTLSSDNQLRKQSETILLSNNSQVTRQILTLLLSNDKITIQLQLVALTLIKNRIANDWSSSSTSDELKQDVKEKIVKYIVNISNPFSANSQLLIRMSLKIIDLILLHTKSEFQFELLNFANDLLTSKAESVSDFYLCTSIIRQVARLNRHLNDYDLINEIASNFFPYFQNFLNNYKEQLKDNNIDLNKEFICYEILKILNYCTTTRICEYHQKSNNLENLCSTLNELFYLFLTTTGSFRNMKWILRFMIKLQIRSAQIKDSSIYVPTFISILQDSVIPYNVTKILEYTNKDTVALEKFVLIDKENDDSSSKERALYYFLIFLTKSVTPTTYCYIEPYMNSIISNVIVKLLSIDEYQIEDFEENPNEFINSRITAHALYSNNILARDVFNSDLESAGSIFITKLIRANAEIVNPLISLCEQILNSDDKKSIVCALNLLKLTYSYMSSQNLELIVTRIIAIASRTSGDDLWLRCLIFDFFSNINNEDVQVDLNSLPVSLDLKQPLPLLIASLKLVIIKSNCQMADPVQVMQILLSVSESENLEITNDLIDVLVEKYPDQLVPYSTELVTNLSTSFMKTLEDSYNEENDKENILLGILNNILTIVMSTNDKNTILKLNDILSPIISSIMDNALLDFLELTIELVEELTNRSENVSHLDEVINSFKNFGFDYYEYYESYFVSCYCYGNLEERSSVTNLIKWILSENPYGYESDDSEFISFLSNIVVEMVLSCSENENDGGLSDEVFNKILQMIYNSAEDKQEFWESKTTFRCIMSGFYRKPMIIMELFGDNVHEILARFERLIDESVWCTVYDLKVGILGLLQIVKGSQEYQSIRAQSMNLLTKLCDRVNDAIDHRDQLIKYSFDENKDSLEDTNNFVPDEEFDELSKVTVLNKVDVFGDLKVFLENEI